VAWAFLSLGIMLGSWWAYYELGWGGWWFWDPVENASFMPWLAGTALIHSLAVTEKRGLFKSWTVLLAIFRLLAEPARYLPGALRCADLGARLCHRPGARPVHPHVPRHRGRRLADAVRSASADGTQSYRLRSLVSRESLLLVNNVVFLVATLTVLFGTLFPLLMDALGQGKYSVGAPYFNAVFVPLMALLIPFMGIGPLSRWRDDSLYRWRSQLLVPAGVAVLVAGLLPLLGGDFNVWVALAVLLAAWLVAGLVQDFRERSRNALRYCAACAVRRRATGAWCWLTAVSRRWWWGSWQPPSTASSAT
jgi:cytochrome c-type biogenesis protein CcmF